MKRNAAHPPAGPARRLQTLVTALIILVTLALSAGPAAAAPPAPPQPLPPQVDLIDKYQGQTLCDPTPKDGTLRLRDLLWRTYGRSIWAGISRDCNVTWDRGVSEHKDGRAIDWGVSVRNPTLKGYGDEFFAWVTANDGEMARRLGIMYIIWDSRMWRQYDMARGFPEYQTCVTQTTTPSYDTTCHRDHMHISMTWHGAGADTSWYSGTPVVLSTCGAGPAIPTRNGTANKPQLAFQPLKAVGSPSPCFLGSSAQTLQFSSTGGDFVQRLRIAELSLNAPSALRLSNSAGYVLRIDEDSAPAEVDMPLLADGLLYVSVPVGQARVLIEGLGRTSRAQYEAFVTQGYRDVLGRDPDPAGLAGWTSAVMSGAVPRGALITELVYSVEGARRLATSFYRDILGRDPDPVGLVGWGNAISQRQVNVKETRRLFWLSEERSGKSGSVEQWVADLYAVELGRTAGPNEQASWAAVAAAQGRGSVTQGVFRSQEWLNRQVTAQYRLMLKREPDPTGLAGWSGVLDRTDLPVLQAALGGSQEYFQRGIR
jgi:hypothetical protein